MCVQERSRERRGEREESTTHLRENAYHSPAAGFTPANTPLVLPISDESFQPICVFIDCSPVLASLNIFSSFAASVSCRCCRNSVHGGWGCSMSCTRHRQGARGICAKVHGGMEALCAVRYAARVQRLLTGSGCMLMGANACSDLLRDLTAVPGWPRSADA